MNRRKFVALLSIAAVARSFGAHAQKAIPVIGVLGAGRPSPDDPNMAAFRRGLSETGYFEAQNVIIEYARASASAMPVEAAPG